MPVGFGIKDAKARQATVVTSPDFTVPTTYTVDMADVFDASDVLSYPVELTPGAVQSRSRERSRPQASV